MRLIRLLLCLAILLVPSSVVAEEDTGGSLLEEITGKFGKANDAGHNSQSATAPSFPPGYKVSEDVRKAADGYAKDYYENLRLGLDHRQRVFEWQHLSTRIIFFVVIAIVVIGLYFSWIQFHAKDGEVGESSVGFSKEGIKVTSPVLGVIILVLSLAFFYLYLVHVYPISELR